jgi:uncharacterized protein YjbI with pentapeptide repeats
MKGEQQSYVVAIVALLVLLLLLFLIVLLLPPLIVDRTTGIYAPTSLQPDERLEAENDVRSTLLQALTGVFFVFTAFFTWRQIQVAQDRQIAERFTRAIEQLGDESRLDVKLGGVYGLESVARSSARDRTQVDQVLAAFALRRSSDLYRSEGNLHGKRGTLRLRAADLNAVLEVLGRRHEYNRNPGTLYLEGLYAIEAHLDDARLDKSFLRNAMLHDSHLNRVHFKEASLRNASLTNCELVNADFSGADLRGTDFKGADLTAANFTDAWYNDVTVWPDGFGDAKARGARWTEEVGPLSSLLR